MKLQNLYGYGVMPIHIGASTLCAALLLSGWVFGLGPLLSESQQATTGLEQAKEAELEAKQIKNELDQVSEALRMIEKELEDQPVSLQSASQINPLLAELANWSETHNLAITRTQAGRPAALTYYDYVPVEIAGEGSYRDFLAFLSRLHGGRGDLGVITFGVKRKPSGQGVVFEIELAWYVLNEEMERGLEAEGRPTAAVPTE